MSGSGLLFGRDSMESSFKASVWKSTWLIQFMTDEAMQRRVEKVMVRIEWITMGQFLLGADTMALE